MTHHPYSYCAVGSFFKNSKEKNKNKIRGRLYVSRKTYPASLAGKKMRAKRKEKRKRTPTLHPELG